MSKQRWANAELFDLLHRGRMGHSWNDIAVSLRVSGDAARKAWNRYSIVAERVERAASMKPDGRHTLHDGPSSSDEKIKSYNPKPPVGRPVRPDIFAGVCFVDSTRAEVNHGSPSTLQRPDDIRQSLTGSTAKMAVV